MRGLSIILLLSFQGLLGQVGINTTNPQEALHIAGSGKMRIEKLDDSNPYNGGGANKKYPLYVDHYGDFTLQLLVDTNSEDLDAFDNANLPNSNIYLAPNNPDGEILTNGGKLL